MQNNTFTLGQKITGQERKVIAGIIAEVTGCESKYQGPPSFAFKAGGWTVDKAGVAHSPEIGVGSAEGLKAVYEKLQAEGLKAEGDIAIAFPASGHTGITLCNLVNLISSKEKLLMKAFDRQIEIVPKGLVEFMNCVKPATIEDFVTVHKNGLEEGRFSVDGGLDFKSLPEGITFSFFNATLDAEEILAYARFCIRLNEQAKTQKYASAKQKEADNAKYAFRCFLLKLGFIGVEYKAARKVLMSKLEGNGSWKNVVSQV